MGTGLPYAVEIALLVLVLPLAFVYLFSLAGVAALSVRSAGKILLSRLRRARRPPAVSGN